MSKLKQFQKSLRVLQTSAEAILWRQLRNRYLDGCKFRRQHLIEGFIVDFVCVEKGLVIELDGGQHAEQVQYDYNRTMKLEDAGFRVLRFWNSAVFFQLDDVMETIYQALIVGE